ncbi:MAG: hypothetical protein KGQ59_09785, partial [Bdellovibrionales bacterium]|nr:hypothetical protein [Bdellovibrionales bacterium]
MRRCILVLILGLSCVLGGCHSAYRRSVGANQENVFTKIFLTDANTAWIAAMESLKSYRVDIQNQKLGFIQTRWTDNTIDKNSVEVIGGAGPYLKAQYRFRVNLSPTYVEGKGQAMKI